MPGQKGTTALLVKVKFRTTYQKLTLLPRSSGSELFTPPLWSKFRLRSYFIICFAGHMYYPLPKSCVCLCLGIEEELEALCMLKKCIMLKRRYYKDDMGKIDLITKFCCCDMSTSFSLLPHFRNFKNKLKMLEIGKKMPKTQMVPTLNASEFATLTVSS